MLRNSKHTPEEVFDFVRLDDNEESESLKDEFEGLQVLCNLQTYRVFHQKGTTCVGCGVVGSYFALEKTGGPGMSKFNSWHFNLYAVRVDGSEIMMTKDHIVSKHRGGNDVMENYQPMCERCNTKKGNMHMNDFKAKQQGTEYNWDEHTANNLKMRLAERYGIYIESSDYPAIRRDLLKKSRTVQQIDGSKVYKMMNLKGREVLFVYSYPLKAILTASEYKSLYEVFRIVPNWFVDQERALQMYDEVIDTVNREFAVKDTPKDTALYFNSCTYPGLLFAKWKKTEVEINLGAWEIVKKNIKKKEPNLYKEIKEETMEKKTELLEEAVCIHDSYAALTKKKPYKVLGYESEKVVVENDKGLATTYYKGRFNIRKLEINK